MVSRETDLRTIKPEQPIAFHEVYDNRHEIPQWNAIKHIHGVKMIQLEELKTYNVKYVDWRLKCEGKGCKSKVLPRYYGLPRGFAIWDLAWRCDDCIKRGKVPRTKDHWAMVKRCGICSMDSIMISEAVVDCECDFYAGMGDTSRPEVNAEVQQCACDDKPKHMITNGSIQMNSPGDSHDYVEDVSQVFYRERYSRSSYFEFHHHLWRYGGRKEDDIKPFDNICAIAPNISTLPILESKRTDVDVDNTSHY